MENLRFLKTVNRSMLPKLSQLTMPAAFARALKLRRRNPPTFIRISCVDSITGEKIWMEYPLQFRRQKNRNGGWRADKKQWRKFEAEQGMNVGDLVTFKVASFERDEIVFECKIWQQCAPTPRRRGRHSSVTVKIEED